MRYQSRITFARYSGNGLQPKINQLIGLCGECYLGLPGALVWQY